MLTEWIIAEHNCIGLLQRLELNRAAGVLKIFSVIETIQSIFSVVVAYLARRESENEAG